MAFLPYLMVATLLAIGAIYLVWLGQQQAEQEAVTRRLAAVGVQAAVSYQRDWLADQLERSGLVISLSQRRMVFLVLFAVHALVALRFGLPLALLLAVSLGALVYSLLGGLYQRRQQQIIAQLPRLLDQVVRLLRTGRTLNDSVLYATRDAEEPLREVMQKLQRNVLMGMTVPEAFAELASVYALKELQVLALGVGVNARYGGSLIELLTNIITLIQQREQLTRQLRAMTGETRTSALVLSVLPILLGVFMITSNPDYLYHMVDDPTGQWVLFAAAGMQVTGMAVIWKMLRSV